MKNKSLYKIKIFSLLLFIFSLPFEYWDPYGISNFFTITKFAGFIYFSLSLLDIKNNFSLQFTKTPVFTLLILWLFILLQAIFNYWSLTTLSIYNFTFFQNVILFWLISNDIISNNSLLKRIFLTLVLSVFLMGSLVSFGIGLDSEIDKELGTFRLTFFGSNPNGTGTLAAVSLVFVTTMLLSKNKFFGKLTLLLILAIPSLVSILSLSGSRGALVVSLLGILALFLFKSGSFTNKISSILLGTASFFIALSQVLKTEVMQNRIELSTSGSGDILGGRDAIWEHALNIFYDNPIFGLGNVGYQYEITQRFGSYHDTHNLFLYFMVTGGIVGLSLYLFFLFQLWKAAKIHYKYNKDAVLIAILIVYLFAVFKSGGAINSKLMWILTAIIFGYGNNFKQKLNNI